MAVSLCLDCEAGPFTPPSFRKLMSGEEILYERTREKIKVAMENGCGLCHLLWLAGNAGVDEHHTLTYQLSVNSKESGATEISPEGAQFLFIRPVSHAVSYTPHQYYICTSPDDPSATEVVARTPILENHDACPKPATHTPLPTRVIDCDDTLHPRLFITQDKPSTYAALSYVWGGTQTYATMTTSLDSYIRGIDQQLIPQTIRDAIEVTNKLGLRYLWVDALCIIQDSDEDKARELVKMRQIYRDAYVTIIASNATSASSGFLQTRTLPRGYTDHPQLPFYCRDGRVGRVYVLAQYIHEWLRDSMMHTVNQRAWCMQERLLSPRKLVYSPDTIEYHCPTAETPLGEALSLRGSFMVTTQLNNIMFVSPDDMRTRLMAWTSQDWEALHLCWSIVTSDYTRRFLSFEGDKLLAFAGVAEEFGQIWGSRAGRYLAGLWENFLPEDLLWQRASLSAVFMPEDLSDNSPRARLSRSSAPSWSWASVDGPVSSIFSHVGTLTEAYNADMAARVLRCDVTLEDERLPYGRVTAASLLLRAVVVPTPWMVSPDVQGPERYLNLYVPTDALQRRMKDLRPNEGVVVGQRSLEEGLVTVGHRSLGASGDQTSVQNVVLHGHQLGEEGELVALDYGTKEDKSLLTFMGDVSIFFDGSEHVTAKKTMAVLVRRFEMNGGSEAHGLLVTDAGEGKFRRIAYWTTPVEPWWAGENDERKRRHAEWLYSEDAGFTIQAIELV